jgi:acetyl/propionyl-CoA carboxylase alpha subunit
MSRALGEFELFGVRHNIPLCLWVINESHFREGNFDTGFLAERYTPERLSAVPLDIFHAASIAAVSSAFGRGTGRDGSTTTDRKSLWWGQNIDSMR